MLLHVSRYSMSNNDGVKAEVLSTTQIAMLREGGAIEQLLRKSRLWADFDSTVDGLIPPEEWLENLFEMSEADQAQAISIGPNARIALFREEDRRLAMVLVLPNADFSRTPCFVQIDCEQLSRGIVAFQIAPEKQSRYEALLSKTIPI